VRWSAAQALSWIICKEPREIAQWTADMGPRIEEAQEALAKAIGSSQVQAWGRPQPHAALELVASGQFRIQGLPVIVDPYGSMVSRVPHKPYSGPNWVSIEFDAHEIKRAFPRSTSQAAYDWVANEAKRLKALSLKVKRHDAVKRCMEETHCTREQAQAAYRTLPDDMKLRRGRPRKPSP
jgi:hypothetical protein